MESRIQGTFTCGIWNPGLWDPGRQLKKSGIQRKIGIRNPSSSDKESGIPYLESGVRSPESRAWNPESTTVLDSLLVYSLIKSVHSNLGLHAAAHDLDIPWIIIKGISDYKDGRKSGTDCWKKFASLMAASLTVHILSDRMVFRDWPHYTETNKYYNKLPATGRCHLF